jgi:hypothetical protein
MRQLEQQLEVQALETWKKGERAREKQGKIFYELRDVKVRLAQKGRGKRSGFRQWLRDNNIPRTSAYRLLNDYAAAHGLPLYGRIPDEIGDADDEAQNGSVPVPFCASPSATVSQANITDAQRKADEEAVHAFLRQHSVGVIPLKFPEDEAKQITEIAKYLAKRFNATPQEALWHVIDQAYQQEQQKEKNIDGTATTSGQVNEPAA